MYPPPPPPPPPEPNAVDYENGGINPPEKPPPPLIIVVMNVINTVTHLLIGAVVVFAFVFANLFNASSLKQHIYLCTIGYVILMSQAVLTISPFNGWSHPLKYKEKKVVHWIMQITGSSLAIAGSIIRITDVNNNFETTHGVLGLIAMLLTILSLIGGVLNLFCSWVKITPMLFKIFHAFIGSLTITIAYVCLCFGFSDTFYRTLFGDTNTRLAVSFTAFALIGTVSSAAFNMFRRIFA